MPRGCYFEGCSNGTDSWEGKNPVTFSCDSSPFFSYHQVSTQFLWYSTHLRDIALLCLFSQVCEERLNTGAVCDLWDYFPSVSIFMIWHNLFVGFLFKLLMPLKHNILGWINFLFSLIFVILNPWFASLEIKIIFLQVLIWVIHWWIGW